jgi:hypothetical protein
MTIRIVSTFRIHLGGERGKRPTTRHAAALNLTASGSGYSTLMKIRLTGYTEWSASGEVPRLVERQKWTHAIRIPSMASYGFRESVNRASCASRHLTSPELTKLTGPPCRPPQDTNAISPVLTLEQTRPSITSRRTTFIAGSNAVTFSSFRADRSKKN